MASIAASAPEDLVHAVVTSSGDVTAPVEACKALWKRAREPYGAVALGRAGALPALINVLQNFHKNAEIALSACGTFSELVVHEDLRAEMTAGGLAGLKAVVEALRSNDGDVAIVQSACAALGPVATTDEVVTYLAQNAAAVVVTALRRHHAHPSAAMNCMAVLNNMLGAKAHRGVVYRAGLLPAVLEAMQRHRADGEVCEHACLVVSALLGQDTTDEEVRRGVTRDVEVGKELVLALRTHYRRPLLAVQATSGIAYFLRDAKASQRAALMREGMAQALVGALKEHPRAMFTVAAACKALQVLTDDLDPRSDLAAELDRAAAAAPVAAALRASLKGENPLPVANSVCALAGLMRIPAQAEVINRLGCAADFVAAMARYNSNSFVAMACASALDKIAASAESQPMLVRLNAAEALAAAIRQHESDPATVLAAVYPMSRAGFRGAPISRDVAATLVSALIRHKANAKLAEAIACVMQSVDSRNPANKQLLLHEVRICFA